MTPDDTIFAIASAPPPAARVVVRLSGASTLELARAYVDELPTSGAARSALRFGGMSLPVTVYVFAGPRSYTGEDVVELHVPGSPWLVRELLADLGRRGGRPAGPGEFTARAYLNGRLDLTAAEGVAAAIAATDERQLRAARQLLAGRLADEIRTLVDKLAQLLALLEAGIDFTEEDVSFISGTDLHAGIDALAASLKELLARGRRFGSLSPHPTVALAGLPNAGKSSLLNALIGRARSVASPLAGTTRDVLTADLTLERGTARLLDLAGLEAPSLADGSAMSHIEQEMQARARRAMEEADVLLLVRDPSDPAPPPDLPRQPDLVVLTKSDLARDPETPCGSERSGEPIVLRCTEASRIPGQVGHGEAHLAHEPGSGAGSESVRVERGGSDLGDPHTAGPSTDSSGLGPCTSDRALWVSSHSGENLHSLRAALDALCFGLRDGTDALALTARHHTHLARTLAALDTARSAVGLGDELVAASLRQALDELGAITGAVSPDDVLGRVFSTFCIGK